MSGTVDGVHGMAWYPVGVRAHVAAVGVLAVLAALVYGRVGGFEYARVDDFGYIVTNGHVRSGMSWEGVKWAFGSVYMSNWHPLTWLSHMLDVSLFGLAPGPQHVVNAVMHLFNSVLLYAIAFRVFAIPQAALMVAALFLVHPQHVESVAWIAERKDLLCGFFYLLAMWLHLRYADRPGAGSYLLVLLAGAAALMSKPMAVTLPLALLLLDGWPLGRMRRAPAGDDAPPSMALLKVVAEKLPLFAMAAGVGMITVLAQQRAMPGLGEHSTYERLANVAVAYVTYLRDMLWPVRLAAFYPLQPRDPYAEVLPSLALLSLACVVAWRWRHRRPWLLFGWSWFLLTLLPVVGIAQVGMHSHADRYMYIPSVGLLLALGAWLIQTVPPVSSRVWRGTVAALLFYAVLGWVQAGYWANPYLMYTRVMDVSGDHFVARVGLSGWYLDRGMLEEAREHAMRAVELGPELGFVLANMGYVELQGGDAASAERYYRRALASGWHDAAVINNLGLSLEKQGRLAEAADCFREAIRLDPALAGIHANLRRVSGGGTP